MIKKNLKGIEKKIKKKKKKKKDAKCAYKVSSTTNFWQYSNTSIRSMKKK